MTINLPNIITVIRILLVPLFIIYLQRHMFLFALIVFAVAGVSDALDGLVARFFNQRTNLGAHLDPIADKLLLSSGFVMLSLLGLIPDWLTVLVISRDIMIIMGVSICALVNMKVEMKPSLVSKITTIMQLLTVFTTLLNQVMPNAYFTTHSTSLFALTAGLTIVSGLHYIYKGLNLKANGDKSTP